jgi:hypothetical protein
MWLHVHCLDRNRTHVDTKQYSAPGHSHSICQLFPQKEHISYESAKTMLTLKTGCGYPMNVAANSAHGIGVPHIFTRRSNHAIHLKRGFSMGSGAVENLRVRRDLVSGNANPLRPARPIGVERAGYGKHITRSLVMGTQHHQSVRIMTSELFDQLDDLTFELIKLAETLPSTIEELDNFTPEEQRQLCLRKLHIQNACAYIRDRIMSLPRTNGGNA